jgi:hypothetical protein
MSASHGYHLPLHTQLADCDREGKVIRPNLKGLGFR